MVLKALAAAASLLLAPYTCFAQGADTPIKLGLILDMSGPYADVTGAGSAMAAKMAVEDFGGKVLGRPIEILVADHQNKPDLAASIAREWFDNQKLTALMDVAASATALAAQDIARQHDKVIMLSGPGTTRLTNESCNPQTVHYAYDTYALGNATGQAITRAGGKSWFFLTADYTFGSDLERDASDAVKAGGGTVLGDVRHPLNTADFSSFLLQAQASKAEIVGLANAGNDTVNTIKQATEFGLAQSGQKLAALLMYDTDVHAIGLKLAQGMLTTSAFYWDRTEATRAFSRRYFERVGKMPNMSQAGVYSATTHYLKAVQAVGSLDTAPVMKTMKETPINDFYAENGRIREDGRMVHDMYLVEVKTPAESKYAWDYYKILATIPGDKAFLPLEQSRCPLVKK
ncbi:amino acid/amide ABC transporter substrate-binding protein, HAAT family [Rhizobiales bacterium GAS188]|nr:amino acid/amide ABC transporter substrate-binding protein, HAAT family [Rhizobiales bacterium GAS188]